MLAKLYNFEALDHTMFSIDNKSHNLGRCISELVVVVVVVQEKDRARMISEMVVVVVVVQFAL